MSSSTSTVRLLFLGDASSAVRSVGRLQSGFGSLARAGKLAVGVIGVGLAGALAFATKSAISYDKSLRNVNSIAKLSESQLQALSRQVLALAKETGKGPTELADGLYDIVSSGLKAADAVGVLRVSAKAATAGMTDTATASKAVVAVLNAYHLSAGKASNVSSLLFQEVNRGVNTFEELATNLGDTVPAAAALKIPFSQVAAGMAEITLHGTSMAEASTQMSRVLAAMVKPTDSLRDEFKKLGYENGQAAIRALGFVGVIRKLSDAAGGNQETLANWLGDIRGIRGVLNLSGKNLKGYEGLVKDLSKAYRDGGADTAAFNEQSKSIAVQWQKAKAGLTAALIPIGQLLFPLLEKGAAKTAEFATSVQTHMPQIRQRFTEVKGAASDLLPVIETLGRVAGSSLGISLLGAAAAMYGVGKAMLLARDSAIALKASMLTLNPIFTVAVVAVGLLTFAYLKSRNAADGFKKSTDAAKRAVSDLADAATTAAQSDLDLATARNNVKLANVAVKDAEDALTKARRSGSKRDVTRAEAELTAARIAASQATLDETAAEQKRASAYTATRKKTKELRAATSDLKDMLGALRKASDWATLRTHAMDQGFGRGHAAAEKFAKGLLSTAKAADAAAAKIAKTNPALAAEEKKAAAAARAVAALTLNLNKLPTKKQVDIYLFLHGSTQYAGALLEGLDQKGKKKKRALGGTVLPGQAYRVGERGEETLVMGRSAGYVYPHGVSPGGGGPMPPISVQVELRVDDPQLKKLIRVESVKASPAIARRLGARSDILTRERR
jgi:TP901 family phage tail tape measure protein